MKQETQFLEVVRLIKNARTKAYQSVNAELINCYWQISEYLLFFHRGLPCLVVVELKAEKFKPGHLGQLNFYLEALDRDVKKEH